MTRICGDPETDSDAWQEAGLIRELVRGCELTHRIDGGYWTGVCEREREREGEEEGGREGERERERESV